MTYRLSPRLAASVFLCGFIGLMATPDASAQLVQTAQLTPQQQAQQGGAQPTGECRRAQKASGDGEDDGQDGPGATIRVSPSDLPRRDEDELPTADLTDDEIPTFNLTDEDLGGEAPRTAVSDPAAPGSAGSCAATNSFATRFIPSCSDDTRQMSPAR